MRRTTKRVMLAAIGGGLMLRRRRYRWSDRVVVIVGGSRGLGLLLARRLGGKGARLVLAARDGAELGRAKQSLGEEGIDAHLVVADVADRAQARALVAEAVQRFGRLDVLINAASIIPVAPLEAVSEDDLRAAMDVNFWGTVHTCWAALPHLKKQPGARLVNVSSIGGAVSVPHLLPYSCAKFAVRGLSEGLQAELAPHGVRVTTVLPWLMRTGSAGHALVKGHRTAEAALFTLAAALPLLTMDAGRAADQIVRATERGRPFLTLGLLGKAARLTHALLPGTTGRVLAVVSGLLPSAPERAAQDGPSLAREHPSWMTRSFLAGLQHRAAAHNNE